MVEEWNSSYSKGENFRILVRSQKSGVRSQESEVRSQKSEVGSQKSGVGRQRQKTKDKRQNTKTTLVALIQFNSNYRA